MGQSSYQGQQEILQVGKKEGKNVIFRVSVTRKALDNLSEAPIEEILKKFKESGALDKVGFFIEKDQSTLTQIKAMLPAEWKKMFEEALKFMKKIVDIMLKIRKGRDS